MCSNVVEIIDEVNLVSQWDVSSELCESFLHSELNVSVFDTWKCKHTTTVVPKSSHLFLNSFYIAKNCPFVYQRTLSWKLYIKILNVLCWKFIVWFELSKDFSTWKFKGRNILCSRNKRLHDKLPSTAVLKQNSIYNYKIITLVASA